MTDTENQVNSHQVSNKVKDIFFLNIEDAYLEAVKQNEIFNDDGSKRLQYCYYDGPLTDITLENFIRLASDDFAEMLSNNQLPIPQVIANSKDGVLFFNEMPSDITEEILAYRNQLDISSYIHKDSYFTDPLQALNVSKQKNRVYCGHPTIDGLQVCYHRSNLPEHNIVNLIHLEMSDFIDFFTSSTFRVPEKIVVQDEFVGEINTSIIEDTITAIGKNQDVVCQQLFSRISTLRPCFSPGEKLRVFIPSRRITTVMQYCSRNVAKEFERRGYEVLFYIDEDEMRGDNPVDYLNRYLEFNPHITFFVNHLNNTIQHGDVVNIVWWQDPMPAIKAHRLLNLRKNDVMFSISPFLDEHLKQCGVEKIFRQHFVIDHEVFNTFNAGKRENKIVFIGGSYRIRVNLHDAEQLRVIGQLLEILNTAGTFNEKAIGEIAAQSSLDYDFIFWVLLHYVIRDYSVRWLCQNVNLPVQVFGRYWELDSLVAEKFKGELKHGVEVASVYKSVKYALVSHPFEINSQRLAEVAACGCIPIVYDCRDIAEQPFWEDHCLFFKTQEDLYKILETQPVPLKAPEILAEYFTYRHAVDNFIHYSGLSDVDNN